jgi:hypothetical protein
MVKSLRVYGLICLFTTAHLAGYAPELAYVGAGVGGGLTGLVAYHAAEGTILAPFRAPLAMLSSGLVGYGMFKFLHQFTPEGRFKRAEDRVGFVEGFYLAANRFSSETETIKAVNSVYIARSWPLIAAFDDLVLCTTKLQEATGLALAASKEDRSF